MLQDKKFTISTPGQYVELVMSEAFTFWRLTRAKGTVTMQFDNAAPIERVAGERGWRREERIRKIKLTSTIAETVVVSVGGEGDEEEGPNGLPNGAIIQGQYPNYTPASVTPETPRFVTSGLMVYGGPGVGVSYPFLSAGTENDDSGIGKSLGVGFTDLRGNIGQVLTPGQGVGMSAVGRASARVRLTIATAGDVLNVVDSSGEPVAVWDSYGNTYPLGVIDESGQYFAQVAGLTGIGFTAPATNTGNVTIQDAALSSVTLTPPPYSRIIRARRMGIVEGVTTFGASLTIDIRDPWYRRIAGDIKLNIPGGTTIAIGLENLQPGGIANGNIGPYMAGLTGAPNLTFVTGSEEPNFGYYNIAGVGSASFAGRCAVDSAYGFRLTFTRTAGAGVTTIDKAALYTRGS